MDFRVGQHALCRHLFVHGPRRIQQIAAGVVDGVQLTPGFLLIAAVLTEIPMAMIILARLLPWPTAGPTFSAASSPACGWWASGSATPHYLFIASVEVLCSGAIVWLAWRWRAPESQRRENLAATFATGD